MNRIYRSVWNEITRTFVAAAETVRGRGKPSSGCSDGVPAGRRPGLTRRRPLPLALEQRFMFDGAVVATADAAAAAAAAEAAAAAAAQAAIAQAPAAVEVRAAEPAKDGGKNEVVFVDTSVKDYKTLEAGIRDGVAIVEIDGSKDGLAQIAKWAQTHSGYDSIAILGHGSQATLNLGTTTLTDASLADATVRSELATVGGALTSDGDLMLYGCDVAKGSDGEKFIADLALATGADVAASTDATGAATKGGDWVLEKTSGMVETSAPVDAPSTYTGVLANTTVDFNDASSWPSGGGDYSYAGFTWNGFNRYENGSSGMGVDGSAELIFASSNTTASITRDGGELFKPVSIALHTWMSNTDLTITFVGYRDGIEVARADYTLAVTSTNTTVLLFSSLGPAFAAIDKLAIEPTKNGSGATSAGFDNFVFTTALLDATTTVSAGSTVAEPVTLPATDYNGNTVNVFDFRVNDAGTSDGAATNITQVVLNTSGTGDFSSVTWRLSGAGIDTTYGGYGTYDSVTHTLTFSGLNISVANGASQAYTVSAYYDCTQADGATFALSLAPDSGLTVSESGSQLASGQAVISNGSGSVYEVTATKLAIETQPAGSTSGSALTTQIVVSAVDAYGNVDTDFNGNVTVNENDAGSLSGTLTVAAANGVATFTNVVYRATADNETFELDVSASGLTGVTSASVVSHVLPVSISSATYDAATGILSVNAANMVAGDTIVVSKLTITGEGGATYALTSDNVTATSATAFAVTLNAADRAAIGRIVNRNGASSTGGSAFNLAAADDWDGNSTSADTSDASNALTAANVAVPTLSGATYDAETGVLTVSGANLSQRSGAANDIDVSKLTLSGDAGDYTLTSASVEITDAGSFSVTLNATDRAALASRLNKSGTVSASGVAYNIAAAEDWAAGADASVAVADLTGNTVSVVVPNAAPLLTPAAPALTGITENDIGNAGQTVESIVGASISDANGDSLGIAITGLAAGNGGWQYSIDGGVTWTAIGVVDNGSALLLRATDKIRFVPNGDNGTSASITYRAWDQTGGSAGGKVSTASAGGKTAFSTATDTASIAVDSVNDAPTAVAITNATVSVFDGVNATVGTLSVTDPDQGDTFTYTVVSVNGSTADTSFSVDAGGTLHATASSLAVGTYTVVVRADDKAGGTHEQTFTIAVSDTLTVTTSADESGSASYTAELNDGAGLSLREAVALVGTRTGGATIRFAAGVDTLTLGSPVLKVNGDIVFDTSAQSALTIAGPIEIASGKTLTIANGDSDVLTLSGDIGGNGTLVKSGAGTLTLAGSNGYGATRIDGGTLALASGSGFGGGTVSLADGTTLAVGGSATLNNIITLAGKATIAVSDAGATVALYGAIGGNGDLVKSGAGTLELDGHNTYTGATRIDCGTLAIGSASLGVGAVSLAEGTTLRAYSNTTIGQDITLAGQATMDCIDALKIDGKIDGSGGLVKTGSGVLTLTGDNGASAWTTTVQAGTLSIARDANLGSGSVSLATGTWLTVSAATTIDNAITLTGTGDARINNSAALTLSGVIVGTGSLVKQGSGTLTLAGANSYEGATTVYRGTLSIDGDGKLGGGALTLQNGATLAVSATTVAINGLSIDSHSTIEVASGATATLSGMIKGGSWTLTKAGAGTLTLDGSVNVGKLAVNAGTLATSHDYDLHSLRVEVESGAIFALGGGATLGALSGGGSVALGAYALMVGDDNSSTLFSGAISGSGGFLKAGSGTLTLTGSNTYTGRTSVASGGTLVLAGGSAIADSSVVYVSGTLILNASETIGALSGGGSVSLVGSTLTVGGGIGSNTFDGVISGSGSLVKVGSYLQTFTKANTYSGTTTVLGGTLALRNNGMIGNGALSLAEGTRLAVTGTPTLTNTVTLTGNATIESDTGVTLTLSGAVGGAGGLVKSGAGTLVLSGTNTYTGTTTVSGGTLSIASATSLGAGAISLAGGTTLAASDYAVLGQAVTIAGSATIDCASALVLSGVVSGDGSLVKTGSGSLTLSGNNNYQGTTTVSAGTLSVDSDASLGHGSVKLAAGTTFVVDQATTIDNAIELTGSGTVTISNSAALALSGTISGDGTLFKQTPATLTLTGGNTYSGGTTVDDAMLAIVGDASLGSGKLTLKNDATLAVSGATTIDNAIELYDNTFIDVGGETTLTGAISGGSGTLTKTGAGTLILAGGNERIGHTVVNGGTLWVNTALKGSVSAQSGTTVGGSGSITESLTIAAGATLAPGGNGVGTLTVNNTLTLDGTLAIEVAGDTSYDQIVAQWNVVLGEHSAIAVTRVGGYARSNATPPFTFIDGASYAISGTFKDIAQDGVLVSGGDVYTVSYAGGGDAHDLVLAGKPVPTVTALNSTTADGVYKAGSEIDIVVSFDQAVDVSGGVPTLLLETGAADRAARYVSGSGSSTLVFRYTVEAGDNSTDLDCAAGATLQLNSATLRNTYGQDAALTLPAGSLAAAKAIVIDTSAPAAPAAPTLDSASDSGSLNSDGITNNIMPTINGTAEANATVTLYDGTTAVGSAIADGSGHWTMTMSTLNGGMHNLTAKATDAAGNVSDASAALTVTIDTQAGAPTALTLAGKAGSATNSATPTIAGNAEAYATVTLYEGGTVLGSATADGAGRWAITSGTTLAEGAHTLTATAIDRAGNASAASSALTINVDTSAPAAPSTPVLAAASDSGSSASDQLTSDTTPTVGGTAEAGSTVTLYDGATVLGSATADGSGRWTITSSVLAAGAHTLTAKATDAAGNVSVASAALAITIDASASAAPAAPTLAAASDSGSSRSDGITNVTTPTISGTAEANATVTLYDGTTVVGSATADGSGNWTIGQLALAKGTHALTARATDAAGNVSGASAALTVTIDTQAGAPSALALAGKPGSTTNSTTPTIAGSAEAYATVTLYDGINILGSATADAAGHWVITSATTLAEGAHALSATAIDRAGNASVASAALAISVDTTAPAAPLLIAAGSKYAPTIAGSAEAGSSVTLYDGATVVGSATADGAGAWSISGASLAVGAHALTAKATDAAGNVSAASSALAVTVEAPVPPPQVLVSPTVVVAQAATSTAPATTVSEVVVASASFIAPTSELALSATLTSSAASAVTPLAAPTTAALVAPATTAFAAPTNEGSSSPASSLTATDATRASPTTAVLTQGGGFQVVVASGASGSSSAAVDGIVVNRGVADQSVGSGAAVEFAIPADAFAAGSASAAVTLSVRQADGRPLPAWLHFDAASGRFDGEPPPGYAGEVAIRVVARDAQGHEAVATFKVRVSRAVNADGQRAQPERGERAGRASLSEQLRAAARTHPALERLARFTGWRDAA